MTKICYTCLLGPYEDLKDPTVPSPGWTFICFTDQPVQSSTWNIIQIPGGDNPQRLCRDIKINFMKWLQPLAPADWTGECLWLDASFQINIPLDAMWRTFVAPLTAPRHPLRHCVFTEINNCLVSRRGEANLLIKQMEAYRQQGLRQNADNIISSGLLMRNKEALPLCEAWWAELEQWSTRDQVAFAKVVDSGQFKYHKIMWDYSQSREIKYFKHFKYRQGYIQ